MTSPLSPPSVPIVRPCFDDDEAEAVARVVRSGWLMQGPEVERFEAALASYLAAPHVVAVSNGTAALELALRALEVGPGDEVITVSHSFIATANSVRAVGAIAVFVDVEPQGLSLDPARVAAALTPRTKAILCVHQLGFVCDLEALLPVAQRAGVPVIEDAACALGSEIEVHGRWQRIGAPHGRIACFSFHPRKVITTGEGGAITTGDAALADKLRRLRQHAIPAQPAAPDPTAPDGYLHPAFNARMTDMAAAIGSCQMRKLPALLAERRCQALALDERLRDHPVLSPPAVRVFERPNWQSYPARLRTGCPMRAAEVLQRLKAAGVSARGGLTNAHEEPAYMNMPSAYRSQALPVSEDMRRRVVMLPIFPGLTPDEQDRIFAALAVLAGR